ncbi:cytochrome c [Undibacterium flavidum]|uniref:Cytochrome c n=1 Tax=Undibacterium flavidum TaxID=2762297 RepID=A0ABR6Y630_9BURK|nr:cytochrome c [Undibacterium flavidum]MBC3872083.1 cytochrome c [Undibacterium flavidum]
MKISAKKIGKLLLLLLALAIITILLTAWYGYRLGETYQSSANSGEPAPTNLDDTTLAKQSVLERGAYLVKLGDCMACHTARGGAPFAGGRIMQSEFGQFLTPNITPDKLTGIGNWTAEDFWNALHNGKGKDGRLLYPAFPFPNYTHVTRTDADAMFSYLQAQAPVAQKNALHQLDFPYSLRGTLAIWRALYFKPGVLPTDAKQSFEWNRGAYLVRGLAHCSACHSSRNSLGANRGSDDFSGGAMVGLLWYAPSLNAQEELNLSAMKSTDIAQLLQHGVNSTSSVNGPMAEVVKESLQHLTDQDAQAIASYLRALPQQKQNTPDILDQALARPSVSKEQMQDIMLRGETIYRAQCIDCHGKQGEGKTGIYPALKGNPSIQMLNISNPVRVILAGGFSPATKANPRPYSMPPFAPFLDDAEVALVLTYIRNAWGNQGSVIGASEINPYRTAALD